jgi:catecholate siderophore receptor
MTIDGVRDSAQYTRSDNFNLEAVELVNGANSVFSGAGSVGGTINLVSKVAGQGDFNRFSASGGTDSYGRLTGDVNRQLNDSTAVRLNVMVHQNDIPGRDYEEAQRWGVAPSIAFGLGSDTRFTLSYLHQEDDNIPSYGVPYFQNAYNNGPLPEADSSNYYGYHNFDDQEITTDAFTAVIDHDFSEGFAIRNLTRWSQIDQLTRVTPPQGTWCLSSGINVSTGAACNTPGFFAQGGPAGNTRDTRNMIIYNQTDATLNFRTGFVEHDLVAGFALTHETYDLTTGNSLRNADGTNVTFPPKSIANPDSTWNGPVNFIVSGTTDGELDSRAVYAFDTLKFTPQWWLTLGARYENNEGSTNSTSIATNGAVTANRPAENSVDLFSYRAGITFKPVESGTLYLSYANSKTPSKSSVNGSCTPVQTTNNAGDFQGNANCAADPETAINIELGAKWDVIEDRLALTAAVFRNDRENYKVSDPGNPNNPSGEQQLDGQARVDGFALGAAGNVTRAWGIFANYTYLDSEVLQSVSDYALGQGADPQKGNPLTNVPKHSASLWTTYAWNGFTFGYGATYQGEFYLNNNAAVLYKAPDYLTHRLMAGYDFSPKLGVQLNVNNVTDKEYYERIRNNGWATPGQGRNAILTLNGSF